MVIDVENLTAVGTCVMLVCSFFESWNGRYSLSGLKAQLGLCGVAFPLCSMLYTKKTNIFFLFLSLSLQSYVTSNQSVVE